MIIEAHKCSHCGGYATDIDYDWMVLCCRKCSKKLAIQYMIGTMSCFFLVFAAGLLVYQSFFGNININN